MNAGMRAGRRSFGQISLRVSLALVACGLVAQTASATPITNGASYSYTTSGYVGDSSGGIPISFQGLAAYQPMVAPGSFGLGSFSVTKPSPGELDFTAEDLPFKVLVDIFGQGAAASLGQSQLTIEGVINGTLTGLDSSSLTATVTNMSSTGPLPFQLADFQVLAPQILAPALVNGGKSPLNVYLSKLPQPPPIPEPATVVFFGVVLGVVGCRVRRKRAA